MTISIVIPTYNGALYIEKALQSALYQTRPADEIIISDDNSTDNTLEICRKYLDRIKIYKNEDGPSGFVNGWNKAIAHATCEYISILHQDDLLDPTFLEEIENAHKRYPTVKHFFVPCKYIDQDGNIIREPKLSDNDVHVLSGSEYAELYEFTENHIHRCPGVVTHREIFKSCGYRKSAGHIADDDFFLRVGNYTDVAGIYKPLSAYREHINSETGHLSLFAINSRLLKDYYYQIKKHKKNPLISNRMLRLFKYRESLYNRRLFVYAIKHRNLRYFIISVKYLLLISAREFGINLFYQFNRNYSN